MGQVTCVCIGLHIEGPVLAVLDWNCSHVCRLRLRLRQSRKQQRMKPVKQHRGRQRGIHAAIQDYLIPVGAVVGAVVRAATMYQPVSTRCQIKAESSRGTVIVAQWIVAPHGCGLCLSGGPLLLGFDTHD